MSYNTVTKILNDIKEFYFKEAPYYKELMFDPFSKKEIEDFEKKIGLMGQVINMEFQDGQGPDMHKVNKLL